MLWVRWLRRLLLAALALLLLAVVTLVASSQLSLDREFSHTRSAESLPTFAATTSRGLVQISAREMSFRARVAGMAGDGPARNAHPALRAVGGGRRRGAANSERRRLRK